MPGRDDWLKTARPAQLPPAPGWTAWNLWGDGASGKTRAALEQMLEWARNPERTRTGRALPLLVVCPDDAEGDVIVRMLREIVPDEEVTVSVHPFWKVEIHRGAAPIWIMRPRMAIENLHGQFIGKALIDAVDAYEPERHEVEHAVTRSLAYANHAQVIRTFRRAPPWPLGKLAGGSRRLVLLQHAPDMPQMPWADDRW